MTYTFIQTLRVIMNKELLAFARILALRDRKTLTGKALKTAEEVGELAKKVLPFENAYATTHRFVERRDILEECIDTILCSLSIAYELQFSDEDVDEMMLLKAQKWANLQAREDGVKYPLPFEMHVTVAKAPSAEQFKSACAGLLVKPIFLALQDTQGETVLEDVMTSSVFFGDNRSALQELNRIADGLKESGYCVVRRKIETVPWHPAAPAELNGVSTMPPGGYFESHLSVLIEAVSVESSNSARLKLGEVAKSHGAHFSRNIFKRLDATAFTVMTTLRAYAGTREAFEKKRDGLAQAYGLAGFRVEKIITEFSLFDSKTAHDASWLSAA